MNERLSDLRADLGPGIVQKGRFYSEQCVGPFVAEKIINAHPRLFKAEINLQGHHLYDLPFCPVGWTELIERLCDDIDSTLTVDSPDFGVVQVKQKLGELRFYVVGKCSTEVDQKIHQRIDLAESESQRVCQSCGEDGERSKDKGWVRVTCEAHKEKN